MPALKSIKALEIGPRQMTLGFDRVSQEEKEALLDHPALPVALVDNQQADESVFQATANFFRALLPDFPGFSENDQYSFAQALRTLFRQWESALDALPSQSREPFWPSRTFVPDHLHVLKHLLARQDTASLICNSHGQQAAILKIHTDLPILTGFSTRSGTG